MYVKKEDVDELESYLEEFIQCEQEASYEGSYWSPEAGPSVDFFFERPHLILPVGFDETRPLIDENYGYWFEECADEEWIRRGIEEAQQVESKYGLKKIPFDFGVETIFRSASQGAWYWFLGLDNGELIFTGPGNKKEAYSAEDLVKRLRATVSCPDNISRTLWLPRIWTPEFQEGDRQKLSEDTATLIQAIQAENISLREINPNTLEELIAELLRERGLEVYVTPRTRDGGRDIIARGESVLGEPLSIAVEIKQKAVVGKDDLYKALKANEDFPAIMLVTAGRFSAGVIKEKQRDSHNLRLMLKDGVALSQWIETYGMHNNRVNKGAFR